MATASFIIPYPNTTENSFGYLLGFIMVRAATESDAHIVALYLIMSAFERVITLSKFVQLLINPLILYEKYLGY